MQPRRREGPSVKPPKIIRPIRLHTTLPEDIRAKLDLHLYSEVEGRVPFGAYQKFILERIAEFFGGERTCLNEQEIRVVRICLHSQLSCMEGEALLIAKALLEKLP